MKTLFKNFFFKKNSNKIINIVSGLPRCGTSMMMRMLESGGMPVITDNLRKADEDNPRGYYEFERVKKIKDDHSWLKECRGKVFKMVSMLLYHLPSDEQYKIVFMQRDLDEMLASQRVMIQRLGKNSDDINDERMKRQFEKHLYEMKQWFLKRDNIDVLWVNFNDVINSPLQIATRIDNFFDVSLNVSKMVQVVEKPLYRQRKLIVNS